MNWGRLRRRGLRGLLRQCRGNVMDKNKIEEIFGKKSELEPVDVKPIAADEAASVFVDNKEQ